MFRFFFFPAGVRLERDRGGVKLLTNQVRQCTLLPVRLLALVSADGALPW